MERKIGETFSFEIKLKVKENSKTNCEGCSFGKIILGVQ